MEKNLVKHYKARATEYERIYYHPADPERQREIDELGEEMADLFREKRVLEVACGTGYWTEIIARTAASIVAVDMAEETLAETKSKNIDPTKASFRIADAYNLGSLEGTFDAGLANFWFSHIPKNRIEEFLDGFHRKKDDTILLEDCIQPLNEICLLSETRFIDCSLVP